MSDKPHEKGKEYLTLNSVNPVVLVVAVVCPNKHEIHEKPYIRYLILVDAQKKAVFIDDPSEEDVARIWTRSHSNSQGGMVMSACPFCQALDQKDKENAS